MPKLYFMVGIPASGKSTWAANNLPGCVIVSTDEIREELYGSAEARGNERRVFATAHDRVAESLGSGRDVIYDATNTNPAKRAGLIDKLRAEGLLFEAVAIVMEAGPQRAIALQRGRARKVPAGAIWHFHRTFVSPTLEEGFSEIRHIPATAPVGTQLE